MSTPKTIFVILRGGMDGLTAMARPDDAALKALRPSLIPRGALDVGGGFAFHPEFKTAYKLFKNDELSFIHAAGLRDINRSHFRAQDILESGTAIANPTTGWLGRALSMLESAPQAIAFGATLPLLLRGYSNAFNWTEPSFEPNDADLLRNIGTKMYDDDPRLKAALGQLSQLEVQSAEPAFSKQAAINYAPSDNSREARRARAKQANVAKALERRTISKKSKPKAQSAPNKDPFEVIGKIIAGSHGPDIGVISIGGWDTHSNQATILSKKFQELDEGLSVLRARLGSVWDDSAIIVTSEFGRTVRANGSRGTDHGTGGLVMLSGGAIKGGQRFGLWPGLETNSLHDGRDLAVANPIFDIFAKVSSAHLGLSDKLIRSDLFPGLNQDYQSLDIMAETTGHV